MIHHSRKTTYLLAGAVLAGTVSALSFGSAVIGNEVQVPQKVLGVQGEEKEVTVSSAWEERGKLLLPSCGVQYALSAKKVSLSDVKAAAEEAAAEDAAADTAASADTTAAAETAASADTAAADTAASADTAAAAETAAAADAGTGTTVAEASPAVGAAVLYALPAESADPAVEETTETAETTETTETTESDAAADTEIQILETSLTPTQEKEQDLVLAQADSIQDVDNATAATLAAAAGGTAEETTAVTVEDPSSESTETSAETTDSTASGAVSTESTETSTETTETTESADTADSSSDSSLAVSTASSYVNIRREPSEDSEIIGKLYANSVGTIVSGPDENGWVEITSGSVTGYVKQDYIATGSYGQQLADSVGQEKAVVTTQTLRVRAAATTESDVISLIGEGQTLDILEKEDGWYLVRTDDGDGYVSADFADVEVWYPEAISIEEEQAQIEAEQEEAEAEAAAEAASLGQQVVDYAMQFLGNPYVWGGTSLTNGCDCSGFTMSVYAHFGVSLPHYDGAQRSCGTAVSSLSAALPGDLICYYGHVGIYIGNGQIINASNPKNGICITNASYRQIAAIRRIF